MKYLTDEEIEDMTAKQGCFKTIAEGSESPWVIYHHQLKEIIEASIKKLMEKMVL